MPSISVIVFKPSDRPFFHAQWVDPVTGRKKTRSLKTNIRRDAERAAASLTKEVNDGTYRPPRTVEWKDFRTRYQDEIVPALAEKTAKKVAAMFNSVEKHVSPGRLAGVTAEALGTLCKQLRKAGRSENTVKSHLSHLRAAMRWAKRVGLLVEVPPFEMPKRLKTARHRSITGEEFDRLLAAVPQVIDDPEAAPSWAFLLHGLWASGLRLGEALNLTWDDDRKLRVKMAGRFPMLWIPAELQKNHKNETVPLAPEFAELLRAVPQAQRTGFVFDPRRRDGHDPERIGGRRSGRLKPHRVGVAIADIGEASNVIVHRGETPESAEYASAHDLRRGFGFRWSQRVMPAVLKTMMRHASINTTMQFYAVGTAEATAATIWAAHTAAAPQANALANSEPDDTDRDVQKTAATEAQN
jgi:integrase